MSNQHFYLFIYFWSFSNYAGFSKCVNFWRMMSLFQAHSLNLVVARVYLVCVFYYKPRHKLLKYRCLHKTSIWLRPTCLKYASLCSYYHPQSKGFTRTKWSYQLFMVINIMSILLQRVTLSCLLSRSVLIVSLVLFFETWIIFLNEQLFIFEI